MNGFRTTLTLGKIADEEALKLGDIIDRIEEQRNRGHSTKTLETALPDDIRARLARPLERDVSGLSIDELWSRFEKDRRPDVKRNTLEAYYFRYDYLRKHFGGGRLLKTIAKKEISEFVQALDLGMYSVHQTVKSIRMILNWAYDKGMIGNVPLLAVRGGSSRPDRSSDYVSRERFEGFLEKIDLPIHRFVLALARYGGFRVPSEIVDLTFEDFENESIRVCFDGKTGGRDVPVFREVREEFERYSRTLLVREGRIFKRSGRVNKAVCAYCKSHDIAISWALPFISLRASCITDYARQGVPDYILDRVFGNTKRIRERHYLKFLGKEDLSLLMRINATIISAP